MNLVVDEKKRIVVDEFLLWWWCTICVAALTQSLDLEPFMRLCSHVTVANPPHSCSSAVMLAYLRSPILPALAFYTVVVTDETSPTPCSSLAGWLAPIRHTHYSCSCDGWWRQMLAPLTWHAPARSCEIVLTIYIFLYEGSDFFGRQWPLCYHLE